MLRKHLVNMRLNSRSAAAPAGCTAACKPADYTYRVTGMGLERLQGNNGGRGRGRGKKRRSGGGSLHYLHMREGNAHRELRLIALIF